MEDQSNEKIWEAIYNVADEEIWATRQALKNKLVDHIRKQFSESWLKNQGDPSRIVSLMEKINPNALMIGFARRFATYKRAHLLFTDIDRLAKIVNNPDYPVQFLFAGKAHPHDGAGHRFERVNPQFGIPPHRCFHDGFVLRIFPPVSLCIHSCTPFSRITRCVGCSVVAERNAIHNP